MSSLRVGSLVYFYQTIDVFGPLDVISSGSILLAKIVEKYCRVSDEVMKKAPDVSFHHIGIDLNPVPLTGGLSINPTCTVDDAPSDIDILILGGPDPASFELHPRFAEYIRAHVAAGRILFTNCTGSCVAALAGVLDGRKATVNNEQYEWFKKRFPNVNWTNDTKWVVDGNIWTAAGAVAGMDMAAQWMKEKYGEDLMTFATMGLDFEPRDINGVLNVIPKRHDESGKQISSHVFNYYDSY